MWRYRNPVEVISGNSALLQLKEMMRQRSYVFVTYSGSLFSNYMDEVSDAIGYPPVYVFDETNENPSLKNLEVLCEQLTGLSAKPDVIVALGGGSVIDTAKVLAASSGEFERIEKVLLEKHCSSILTPTPIIAIPTTAGTGSEVTCWGTVWDPERNAKYSLMDERLYPEAAFLYAEFTQALPVSITIATGLDALSHALESLWNKNRNPVSAGFAINAAKRILAILPEVIKAPDNIQYRQEMQEAALLAGLAFSGTKTSIAHNISYTVTLDKGTPHGVACSFTLPTIIRSVDLNDNELVDSLKSIFGLEPAHAADWLDAYMKSLGIETSPTDYGYRKEQWEALVMTAGEGERGKNFSGSIAGLIHQFTY